MGKPLAERFWAKVNKTEACWLWTGGNKGRTSHGVIQEGRPSRRLLLAHRVSWEMHNGPVPEGLMVCHTCDVGACVNPAHLFLGTQADNLHDMDAKGRRVAVVQRGESHAMVKLTEQQVVEIRQLARMGLNGPQIAARFGVYKNSVYNILNGKTWGWLN